MLLDAYNPSCWKTEERGLLKSKESYKPEQCSKTLLQNEEEEKDEGKHSLVDTVESGLYGDV